MIRHLRSIRTKLSIYLMLPVLAACGTTMPELKPVEHVDLSRFMGDWYVIANIPTFLEKSAHNAVETYELNEDGTIATTFTFRDGSFDGKQKTYTPKGFVTDHPSNAVWGMRFIWPIKADYRIIYLDDSYSTTIIGRNKRDYVWLMARRPELDAATYDELLELIGSVGYDLTEVRRVPQKW
ncbi:MAG: lipocalin family protein [Woeseia sp.]